MGFHGISRWPSSSTGAIASVRDNLLAVPSAVQPRCPIKFKNSIHVFFGLSWNSVEGCAGRNRNSALAGGCGRYSAHLAGCWSPSGAVAVATGAPIPGIP
jgi:hypothetical protein